MSDPPSAGRWRVPVLFAVFSAGLAIAVWFAIDLFGAPLRQLPWPFGSVGWIALFMGISGFLFGQRFHAQQLQRAAAREDPVEDDEAEEPADVTLPEMPAFADRVAINRRQARTLGGTTVDVFDLTTNMSDGDGGTVRVTRTIVLMPASGLPNFNLRPVQFQDRLLEWTGLVGLEFDARAVGTRAGEEVVAQFAAMYRLTVVSTEAMMAGTADEDEEPARRVFTLEVMRTVLDRADWRVQSHGGFLACWEGQDPLGPKRREKLVADAVKLRAVFLAAHSGAAGEPVAAPQGVAPVRQRAARVQATLLGGTLGAFAGFFSAALLQVGEVFGRENMSVVFPTAIVCGVLLGVTIGRLIPLRQPLLQKPRDARREKVVGCAVLIGLFGGFFAGGILGVIVGELIGLKIGDHKPRQLLFFGGIGAGTFLGPVILGMTTNTLYQWIAGRRDTVTQTDSNS